MKTNIYVIYGGQSPEHDVSLKTAFSLINHLDRSRYGVYPIYIEPQGMWRGGAELTVPVDSVEELRLEADDCSSMSAILKQWYNGDRSKHIVFPALHGPNGEDGTLQGMLDMLNVPYVGNGVFASAAGMDKAATKRLMEQARIPQAAYRVVTEQEWVDEGEALVFDIEDGLGYPCYVKPARMGSSIGIERCVDRSALRDAAAGAFRYDRKIVVESEVVGREVQFAVLGNDRPYCSEGGEFERELDFFSYSRKYGSGKLTMRIPARLDAQVHEQLQNMALKVFRTLDGAGLMRVDFFVTDENHIYFNEANTLPGFTENSMYPAMLTYNGLYSFSGLLDELIRLALERFANTRQGQTGGTGS
ncbi:D-alanine--D-alanine ligase family protein [Paenibacillus hodogayensis]|uniref:D-alanine--D-alanine ligase n=1 Tax=Paenibacillus hodogayensis TaxID=279208 RepID=A0ABV5VS62_9BACL